MKTFSFHKDQRLTLKKEIEALFRQGKSFHSGALRVVYQISINGPKGIRVLITVPRKRFRKASDRNRIRRVIREAYRLNRPHYIPNEMASGISANLGFVYTGDSAAVTLGNFSEVVSECLKILASEINSRVIAG